MIVKKELVYPSKKEMRRIHVYLPDDYYETDERYPVMYFFDGHNLFSDSDATYGKSWGLKDFLDNYSKMFLVVGLECGHNGNERLSEYCPYTLETSWWGHIEGLGDETMRWILEDIKPTVDNELRTYSFREATAIGGSSMGGLMALYAGIKYSDIFSKCACLSSAVGFCMDSLKATLRAADIHHDTKFYMSWGTEEAGGTSDNPENDMKSQTALNNRTISELINLKGGWTKLFCQRYGSHCEADWEKQVPLFMDYLWYDIY